ncbi:MAG: hypothetical protein K6G81_11080 [Lachnospiraceae bacterium]|nr:hypothetical protein [Lachnospiraceae bacterium]
MKKLSKLLTKFFTVIAALAVVLSLNGIRTLAHDYHESPEAGDGAQMVFSVRNDDVATEVDRTAQGATDDSTNAGNVNTYDGQPVTHYYQIHVDVNADGEKGRYSVPVSGAAVSVAIDRALNEFYGITEDDPAAYRGAMNLNELALEQREGETEFLVEQVLAEVDETNDEFSFDQLNQLAFEYMNNKLELGLGDGSIEWDIDWYVIKYQNDSVGPRFHVDGAVRIYEMPAYDEWNVIYKVEKENPVDGEDKFVTISDGTIEVISGDTPAFSNDNVKNVSALGDQYSDKDSVYSVVVKTVDGVEYKYVVDPAAKTITITYVLPEPDPEPDPEPEPEPSPEPTPDPDPIPFIIIPPTDVPTEAPTEVPTEVPSEVPTEEPTPEPEIDLDEVPETPEGAPEEDIELDEVPETPEGAPEEDVDVDVIETPQGDVLPETGVASAAVFYCIGSACAGFGAMIARKSIRKDKDEE